MPDGRPRRAHAREEGPLFARIPPGNDRLNEIQIASPPWSHAASRWPQRATAPKYWVRVHPSLPEPTAVWPADWSQFLPDLIVAVVTGLEVGFAILSVASARPVLVSVRPDDLSSWLGESEGAASERLTRPILNLFGDFTGAKMIGVDYVR